MLKIYGRANSINVQKVMWVVGDLDIPHTRVDVGGQFGQTKDAWYVAMNPNSVVPTIDYDGFVLWESNTIVRYLGAKHGANSFWPADSKVRANAECWMDWQLTILAPAMLPVFWGLVRTPPEQRDVSAIEAGRQKCIGALKMLDRHLAMRDFVGGNTLTVGDVPVGVFVSRWYKLPIDRPALPSLEEYYARLKQRPGFAIHVDSIALS